MMGEGPIAPHLETLDRVLIRDLMVRGIVGINPEERANGKTFW